MRNSVRSEGEATRNKSRKWMKRKLRKRKEKRIEGRQGGGNREHEESKRIRQQKKGRKKIRQG